MQAGPVYKAVLNEPVVREMTWFAVKSKHT